MKAQSNSRLKQNVPQDGTVSTSTEDTLPVTADKVTPKEPETIRYSIASLCSH